MKIEVKRLPKFYSKEANRPAISLCFRKMSQVQCYDSEGFVKSVTTKWQSRNLREI